MEIRDIGCLLMDPGDLWLVGGIQIDGVLGCSGLTAGLLTLDGPRKRVTFEVGALPPVNGTTVLPLVGGEGPVVEFMWEGKPLEVYMDSGFNGWLMLEEPPEDVPFLYGPISFGVAQTWVSSIDLRWVRLRGTLGLGRVRMEDPAIMLGGVVNLIGQGLMSQYRITFDLRHRRVRILDGPTDQKPRGLDAPCGAFIDLMRVPARILAVRPDSEADMAGLRAGDEVLWIDGICAQWENRYFVSEALDKGSGLVHFDLWRDGRELQVMVLAGTPPW